MCVGVVCVSLLSAHISKLNFTKTSLRSLIYTSFLNLQRATIIKTRQHHVTARLAVARPSCSSRRLAYWRIPLNAAIDDG